VDIYQKAVKIVNKLVLAGYKAYFAGGWVRDLLLGHPSDDIDIATDAPPYEILDLFPRTIRVGVAFGVVIVDIEGHQFEVATFRKDVSYSNGRKPDKVEMSSPEEDAKRRDFTINGMFYDPIKEEIYDFVGGRHDLKQGIIRCIGEPDERFKEDRLRMIRAVRFATRFGFVLDPATQDGIKENCETLFPAVAMERIWHEMKKMSKYPNFEGAVLTMHRLGLLGVIFPCLKEVHLNTIKHLVAPFHTFPGETPTLLYILQLFPSHTDEELAEITDYLKLSGAEKKLALYWNDLKRHCQEEGAGKEVPMHTWAHLYANPSSRLCLEILDPAPYKHSSRQEILHPHIQRLIAKKPLITSFDLQQEGIPPSILMGQLMHKAEEITINGNYADPEHVMVLLKNTSLWPK
jgi:poly(A) polymerase